MVCHLSHLALLLLLSAVFVSADDKNIGLKLKQKKHSFDAKATVTTDSTRSTRSRDKPDKKNTDFLSQPQWFTAHGYATDTCSGSIISAQTVPLNTCVPTANSVNGSVAVRYHLDDPNSPQYIASTIYADVQCAQAISTSSQEYALNTCLYTAYPGPGSGNYGKVILASSISASTTDVPGSGAIVSWYSNPSDCQLESNVIPLVTITLVADLTGCLNMGQFGSFQYGCDTDGAVLERHFTSYSTCQGNYIDNYLRPNDPCTSREQTGFTFNIAGYGIKWSCFGTGPTLSVGPPPTKAPAPAPVPVTGPGWFTTQGYATATCAGIVTSTQTAPLNRCVPTANSVNGSVTVRYYLDVPESPQYIASTLYSDAQCSQVISTNPHVYALNSSCLYFQNAGPGSTYGKVVLENSISSSNTNVPGSGVIFSWYSNPWDCQSNVNPLVTAVLSADPTGCLNFGQYGSFLYGCSTDGSVLQRHFASTTCQGDYSDDYQVPTSYCANQEQTGYAFNIAGYGSRWTCFGAGPTLFVGPPPTNSPAPVPAPVPVTGAGWFVVQGFLSATCSGSPHAAQSLQLDRCYFTNAAISPYVRYSFYNGSLYAVGFNDAGCSSGGAIRLFAPLQSCQPASLNTQVTAADIGIFVSAMPNGGDTAGSAVGVIAGTGVMASLYNSGAECTIDSLPLTSQWIAATTNANGCMVIAPGISQAFACSINGTVTFYNYQSSNCTGQATSTSVGRGEYCSRYSQTFNNFLGGGIGPQYSCFLTPTVPVGPPVAAPALSPISLPTGTGRSCPRGYTFFPDVRKCYALHTNRVSWYAANQFCSAKHKRAHLLKIDSSADETYFWLNFLSNYNVTVWIALNKVDNPLGSTMQWYLLGSRMLPDQGYRGHQLSAPASISTPTSPSISNPTFPSLSTSTNLTMPGNDYNCVAWAVLNAVNANWQLRSCSNQASTGGSFVEGFVCQYDL